MIAANNGKQPEEEGWVRKAPEKEVSFDLDHTKETFMEAKKSFTKASASWIQDKMQEISVPAEVDSSVLTTFWETCMKLLYDRNVVEGLQELINKCTSKRSVRRISVSRMGPQRRRTW